MSSRTQEEFLKEVYVIENKILEEAQMFRPHLTSSSVEKNEKREESNIPLRILSFPGIIKYIFTIEQASYYCRLIPQNAILGFDAEWRPTFVKNKPRNKVALIQICFKIGTNGNEENGQYICYLLHIHVSGFPCILKNILEHPDIKKVGVSINGDKNKLETDFKVNMRGCVDISSLYGSKDTSYFDTDDNELSGNKKYEHSEKSLAGLTERLLCSQMGNKSKRISCSNWESFPLTDKQKLYATDDAYASLKCYEVIVQLPDKMMVNVPQSPEIKKRKTKKKNKKKVPKNQCSLEANKAYNLFMGINDENKKYTLLEICERMNHDRYIIEVYLAEAILTGREYDWKRLMVSNKCMVIVARLVILILCLFLQSRTLNINDTTSRKAFMIEEINKLKKEIENHHDRSIDVLIEDIYILLLQPMISTFFKNNRTMLSVLNYVNFSLNELQKFLPDEISIGILHIVLAHLSIEILKKCK